MKARGAYVHIIQEHDSYKRAILRAKNMLDLFQTGNITGQYIHNLKKKAGKEEIVHFLNILATKSVREIDQRWHEIEKCFQRETDRLSTCCAVLNAVNSNCKGRPGQLKLKKLLTSLETVDIGQVTTAELQSGNAIWQNMSECPEICLQLKDYVKSKVFWNSYHESVKCNDVPDDIVCEDVDVLQAMQEMTDQTELLEPIHLIKELTEKAIPSYKQAWTNLIKDRDADIRSVLKLISGVTIGEIDNEIVFAESILSEEVPHIVKLTLKRLQTAHKYEETAESVKKVLEVFKIQVTENDDLYQALHAFDAISGSEDECCSFDAVVKSLDQVDRLSKDLTNNTVDILNALTDSSTLIDFLKQILDEDIRNLIDATEDISEQYVQESTVSALIEVKSFLHAHLVEASQGISGNDFLSKLNEHTKQLTENASKLPGKIFDCSNSLHNLKSLYENLANRGQMTADIIANILTNGKFIFQMNQEDSCSFFATYEHNSKTEVQKQSSLLDLRSRARLLMHARSKSHDTKISGADLEKFVTIVDLSVDVTELIDDLHQSGNIDFMTYKQTADCENLNILRTELEDKYMIWSDHLSKLRSEYYLLNFIHGPELHMLYNFFENDDGGKKVATIMRFIHPSIEVSRLIAEYNSHKSKEAGWSKEQMLKTIGEVLHSVYQGTSSITRPFRLKTSVKKMADVVQTGKVFVAALEENSNQVVKTLLGLYYSTTGAFPEPYQVLFCSKDTTWNEIELLLCRCFGLHSFKKQMELFCIANVELLLNELQFRLIEELKVRETGESFLLALICRGSSSHPFMNELGSFGSKTAQSLSDEKIRQAFGEECPDVLTYTSAVSGLGKTTEIKETAFLSDRSLVTIHISGPLYKKNIINQISDAHIGPQHALHIDIGTVDNPLELDTFIFELVVLGYVTAGFNAVCLQTTLVFIEIANTINDTLRNSLNTAMYFKREHMEWKHFDNFNVSEEMNSPVQVICHYLQCQENGEIDKRDLLFTGNKTGNPLGQDTCRKLLKKHFGKDNELSFAVVNIFIQVLAEQLKKLSCSLFFRVSNVRDMLGENTVPTVRSTLLKALVEASKEFSSRSIVACRSSQQATTGQDAKNPSPELKEKISEKPHKIAELLKQRVDGMIRWEDSNHLIFVFHCQNIQTLSPLYRDINIVPSHIKGFFESQIKRPMKNFKNMEQETLQAMLQNIARSNPQPLNEETLKLLRADYALTPDNLLKMVLIMLRIKAHIPVIIMGETGCGKTSLIRYLATVSGVEFDVLSIHAGTEMGEILSTIDNSNATALSMPEKERWLLLDEINTSEHIGLMSSVVCSNTCLNRKLVPNIVVMAACNPYKLRTESAVCKAGLTEKIKSDELSKLVYRVHPLPERMVDYVWDFGSLSDQDEALYIRRMINDVFHGHDDLKEILKELLSRSQRFVRRTEAVSYCVSLRDVQRCKTLIKWFLKILPEKGCKSDVEFKSFILAMSICYHSRFADSKQRQQYRKELENVFLSHEKPLFTEKHIHDIILREQRDIVKRMDLPPGTARNSALQENVFVILVCLLNKVPVFLVGKPGCSKSLSIQVIRSNLRGKDSKDDFFKSQPQLYCVSFQGSESSTSDGIQKVFEKAIRYQESNNADEVLSVVILDEIGLAEISKSNPLKVLHGLLEPNGRPQPDVAVVGISNWALDASKMNRAIHLSRPDMDENELFHTALAISESFSEAKQKSMSKIHQSFGTMTNGNDFQDLLESVAKSYISYTEILQFRHFHGLRDFYSLVKFVSKHLIDDGEEQSLRDENEVKRILHQGLQRNFGGLPSQSATLLDRFRVNSKDLQTNSVIDLMKDNVQDKMARHLMCITSGEAVSSIVENLLTDIGREERVLIFGSHFEEDQTEDYNYRTLSRIILCMEQGFVLILRDLESIYGSLYDMLNQNYTIIGRKKHCRIALGHYSNPICQVHDCFRCIVLVDERNVDHSDPPFLNRFEKQFVRFTDVLRTEECHLLARVEEYICKFCSVEDCHFDIQFCFPLYSQDLIASLVMQISRECAENNEDILSEDSFEMCKQKLMYIAQPDAVLRLGKCKSKDIQENSESIKEAYFRLPLHSGIVCYMNEQMAKQKDSRCLMTAVMTNSSIHAKNIQLPQNPLIQVEKLAAIKSEKQLTLRMQYFWSESKATCLFFHCSANEDARHIALAKTIIESTRSAALKESPGMIKHVYLIMHLDRRSADKKAAVSLNFLSGWDLVLLDRIEQPSIALPHLCEMSLFDAVQSKIPLTDFITEQLFFCFTRIKYQLHGRNIESIHNIIQKMKMSKELLDILEDLVCESLKSDNDSVDEFEWQQKAAFDAFALNTSCSFVTALEQSVLNVIKIPLAKLLIQLEKMCALSSYFYDASSQRLTVWERMVKDRTVLSMTDTPSETGPECYLCTCGDLTLRMPLSKLVFDRVEGTKDEFLDSFIKLKGKFGVDETEEMDPEIIEELLRNHESVVNDNLPDLDDFQYDEFYDDYMHDFANLISYATSTRLHEDKRIQIVLWTLKQRFSLFTHDPLELFVKLHATLWIYYSSLSAEHQLIESCADLFNNDEHFLELMKYVYPENVLETYKVMDDDSQDITFTATDKSHSVQPNSTDETAATHVPTFADDSSSSTISKDEEKIQSQDLEKMTSESKTAAAPSGSIRSDVYPKNVLENYKVMDDESQDTTCKATDTSHSGQPNSTDETTATHVPICSDDVSSSTISIDKEKIQAQDLDKMTSESKTAAPSGSIGSDATEDVADVEQVCHTDTQAKLVEFISLQMLPTQSRMNTFDSVENWSSHVSVLLPFASQVSLQPRVFHSLRFTQDLVCLLQFREEGNELQAVCKLGEILHSDKDKKLDSKECFITISDLIFPQPQRPSNSALQIITAYLSRCLAADPESSVMKYLLELLAEGKLMSENCIVLKYPLHSALSLEIEEECDEHGDLHDNIYSNLIRYENCDLDEESFLHMLDETLQAIKYTEVVGSPLSVLVVDILEEHFDTLQLSEEDIENEPNISTLRSDLMSAHQHILSANFGLKFLVAVSFYKSFAKYFGQLLIQTNFDITRCSKLFPEIRAVMNNDEKHMMSSSIRQFLFKTFGQDLLPWTFQKLCDRMHNALETFQCPEWIENYFTSCIEGNPLFLHSQSEFREMLNVLLDKDSEKQEQSLKLLVQKASEDSKMLLGIHSVALCRFYIARSYRRQDDTYTVLAKKINRIASDASMDSGNLKFLRCSLGVEDFICLKELTTESGLENTIISALCGVVYALLLASNQKSRGQSISFLAKCLVCPETIQGEVYTWLESATVLKRRSPCLTEGHFGICSCGFRFVGIKSNIEEEFKCPVCSESLDVDECLGNTYSAMKDDYCDREFCSVTIPLVRLFIDICLFGSLAMEFATSETLQTVAYLSECSDIPGTLISRISKEYNDLTKLTGMGLRDLFVYLQACLLQLKDLFCEEKGSIDTTEKITEWCFDVEKQTQKLFKNRYETIMDVVQTQAKAFEIPTDAIELCINENDLACQSLDTKTKLCHSLFRVQGRPSISNLAFEVDILPKTNEEQYPFLVFVLKELPRLEFTKYIVPLVQWHLMTVAYIGYRFKRQDLQEMTVQNFLSYDEDERVRDVLHSRFKSLQNALEKLVEQQHKLETPVKRLDLQTKMKECLIIGQKSLVFAIVKELVDIHNEFLDSTLLISAKNDCQALKCLRRGKYTAAMPCRSVSDAPVSAIASYEWDADLLNFSHADLTYGCGRYIRYEFDAIEKTLALELVSGKSYIILEESLPSVVFVDELYLGFSKIAKELNSTIPQQALPADIVNEIQAKRRKHPRLTADLITHVGVLIVLAKKTKGGPATSVIEFVEKWKNYLTNPLPMELLPTPEDSVKLCHLVSLYGLLEELNADSFVDSLGDKYRESFSDTTETQLKEVINLNQAMGTIILKAAKRYVYRVLSVGDVEPSRSLSECLEDDSFWPLEITGKQDTHEHDGYRNPIGLIPGGLRVQHLYKTITLMTEKIQVIYHNPLVKYQNL